MRNSINKQEENKMKEIKTGEAVRLKSGGPRMTVESIIDGSTAVCLYFNAQAELQKTHVKLCALEVFDYAIHGRKHHHDNNYDNRRNNHFYNN